MDIGNTRTKLGIFHGKNLVEKQVWTEWTLDELRSLCNAQGVERLIVSSVASTEMGWLEGLDVRMHVVELTHETPLPFRNAYKTPQTLGKDRLAAVAGAHALYGGADCLVVDCGTCIKYDLLDAAGTYHGGNIAPGASMRQKAMHHFTARLPEVPLAMPENPVGNSTVTALQNGAFLGAALEIEGFVRLFEEKRPDLNVILTGGDADFFEPYLRIRKRTSEPDLTLLGLNHILSCAF
jgi:type III pantothenate kinase